MPSSKVYHVRWKDQAFVLMISSILLIDEKVIQLRKRPKETSFKAKTSRVPFREDLVKELSIPVIMDAYNYHMGTIDEFDHLIA
jgi:hypothetical protein